MSSSFEGVYEPGIVDPGTPITQSTVPFWHRSIHRLSNHQSTWPTRIADVLIIGSGISGTSLAHSLTSKCPGLDVVMVDARPLCAGATARNGGHIKTMTYAVWEDRKRLYGIDEAVRLCEFEHSHLKHMSETIRELRLDCDLTLVDGVDAYYDQRVFEKAVVALNDMRVHAPHIADKYKISTDPKVMQQDMKLSKRCIGVIVVPAASVWPYKMVTGMLEKMITSGRLNIQTNTTVNSIDDKAEDSFAVVHTSRGDIKAKRVVHATNGWIGHLIPELRPYISPARSNVSYYEPVTLDGKRLPAGETKGASALGLSSKYSFWLRYATKDYDYLITREDGGTIVGRANLNRRAVTNDDETDILPQSHLRGFHSLALANPLPDAVAHLTQSWSGPVAFTQDAAPLVGPLDFLVGRSHQLVCGGYHAIGMIRAFRTGQMVAAMILGEKVSEEYPRSFLVTPQRMKALGESLEAGKPQPVQAKL